jgi:hypothetical protein
MLCRDVLPAIHTSEHVQRIPLWSGFNKAVNPKTDTYTSVAYVPIIEAKPSDPSTVYSTMVKCQDMTNALGQKYSVQTMDQQLYAVAQHVKWHLPEKFQIHFL